MGLPLPLSLGGWDLVKSREAFIHLKTPRLPWMSMSQGLVGKGLWPRSSVGCCLSRRSLSGCMAKRQAEDAAWSPRCPCSSPACFRATLVSVFLVKLIVVSPKPPRVGFSSQNIKIKMKHLRCCVDELFVALPTSQPSPGPTSHPLTLRL